LFLRRFHRVLHLHREAVHANLFARQVAGCPIVSTPLVGA